ncbi:gluconokinase [Aestuariibacter sp. A3R04]|nr:gluconokinase [Aestuariibacter sp. A3R04]
MGVSGSGKSTVGEQLAKALHAVFIDGDDLHPPGNVAKMSAGEPLTDDDRRPWLERVSEEVRSLMQRHQCSVIVCSALKKQYRDIIRAKNEHLYFLFLDGPKHTILQRMAQRKGHFMKPNMLDSQFATLERPTSDETDVFTVPVSQSPEAIVNHVLGLFEQRNMDTRACLHRATIVD